MIFKINKRLALIFLTFTGGLSAEVLVSESAALKTSFPEAAGFEARSLTLSAQDRAWIKAELGRSPGPSLLRYHRALDSQGGLLGLALVDDELGKHQPITYMVAVGLDLKIRGLEMLIFREAQGDGVRSRRFRSQFKGKGLDSPLALGRDLDAVTGATISSRTLAYGARKCLLLARRLLENEPYPKPKTKIGERK